jgi:hypothetical protein
VKVTQRPFSSPGNSSRLQTQKFIFAMLIVISVAFSSDFPLLFSQSLPSVSLELELHPPVRKCQRCRFFLSLYNFGLHHTLLYHWFRLCVSSRSVFHLAETAVFNDMVLVFAFMPDKVRFSTSTSKKSPRNKRNG